MSKSITHCRLCKGAKLDLILDLGNQSFTGIFPKTTSQPVPEGPLSLVKCQDCDLVQLLHSFDFNQLYGMSYGYRSGLNQSMVKHLQSKVEKLVTKYAPKAGDLIIDIGSNDSTLLQAYPRNGMKFLGVDPSGVKFQHFYPDDVQLIPDFFSEDVVKNQLGEVKAKLITSIAMFYDLEDPSQFVQEIANLLSDDGVWTFEQSYLPFMLDTLSYDTVCHEHLEYYALKQIKKMTDKASLKIIDIEFNDINGGSFSVSACKKTASYPEATRLIEKILADEEKRGLSTLKPYLHFAESVETHRDALLALLIHLKSEGKHVLGYGASTKGNVLIQHCNLTNEDFKCIAEVNEDKFGSFTPGSYIPIVSEKQAKAEKPDYFLVFPWHFKKGILEKEQAFIEMGGKFIFPLPKLEIISKQGSIFPEFKIPATTKPNQEQLLT